MATATAQVEVLTAEVRVLMVGSRQVTLSVYRQLDPVHTFAIDPFGRVSDEKSEKLDWPHDPWYRADVYVVGVDQEDGALVRSRMYVAETPDDVHETIRSLSRQIHENEQAHEQKLREVAQAHDEMAGHFYRREVDSIERDRLQLVQRLAQAQRALTPARANLELAHRWQALPLIVLAGLR
jgi:hypothetical protein